MPMYAIFKPWSDCVADKMADTACVCQYFAPYFINFVIFSVWYNVCSYKRRRLLSWQAKLK